MIQKKVLGFIGNTEVGRPMTKEENRDYYWDIERPDQALDEGHGILRHGEE